MEKDLPQNHYFIDVKNQQIPEDILRVFAEIFLLFQWGKCLILSKKVTLFHPLGCTETSTMAT